MSDEIFFSTAQAVGKGIDYLSNDTRIKTLSKISDEETRFQIALMYSTGEIFPFLKNHADILLELLVSDGKARGRTGIEEVLKAQLASDRQNMRDKLLGFIGGNRGE